MGGSVSFVKNCHTAEINIDSLLFYSSFVASSSALPHDASPLLQHMREQHIKPRHINRQYSPQPVSVELVLLARSGYSTVHEPTLARYTQRIQHQKSVIPQPRPQPRHANARQVEHKVTIPHDLGEAPGKQHGAVRRRGTRRARESVRRGDEVHEKKATSNLHQRRQKRCAHNP